MPVGSRCVYWVSRMHARTSLRGTRIRPHVVPYCHHTDTRTHTHVIRIRTRGYKDGASGASTPPCQPPVVAVKTRTEIRTSERARENGKDERMATSNGREKQMIKKKEPNAQGCGIWGDCRISESADPQEAPFRVTKNISAFFRLFLLVLRVYLRLQMRLDRNRRRSNLIEFYPMTFLTMIRRIITARVCFLSSTKA